jgi:hypothetical protein
MWIEKEKLVNEISWDEILDWVVLRGVLWVEIKDKMEV